jgi:hypothetical protein
MIRTAALHVPSKSRDSNQGDFMDISNHNLIGKTVRYKRCFLTPKFLLQEGEWAIDCVYQVKMIVKVNGKDVVKAKIDGCKLTFTIEQRYLEIVNGTQSVETFEPNFNVPSNFHY